MIPVASPIAEALRLLSEGRSLTADQSSAAVGALMSEGVDHAEAGALLLELRAKGETAAEITGAAAALRAAMVVLPTEAPEALVDTCGTGGGDVRTLNISTAAALLAAGAGVRVAKHGNRSHTSRSGSADVLEALGIPVELAPREAAQLLAATGFTFMYAPLYHPAMRHVAPVRRDLGVRTMMNLLGPLANPARAGRQVIGTAELHLAPLMAAALASLGTRHALVVHAEVGMDEISPVGATQVWEVSEGKVERWELRPEAFGHAAEGLEHLAGGEPGENAERIEAVLSGAGGEAALRAAVVLNAAGAIYVAGLESGFGAAVGRADAALAAGAGRDALERVRAAATGMAGA